MRGSLRVRVPELTAGERSGLFAMEDALYDCYLRVGDLGPWAGLARLEMPSGIGHDATVEAADQAAGWLPGSCVGAAPGRAGPGEPDADRGSRTAPASPSGRRAPRVARGARGRTRTQPRRTDGMIAVVNPRVARWGARPGDRAPVVDHGRQRERRFDGALDLVQHELEVTPRAAATSAPARRSPRGKSCGRGGSASRPRAPRTVSRRATPWHCRRRTSARGPTAPAT